MSAMPELLHCAIRASHAGMPNASLDLVAQLKDFMVRPILEQLKSEPDAEVLAVCCGHGCHDADDHGFIPCARAPVCRRCSTRGKK